MTNMQRRVISALVLAPIFIASIMLQPWLFAFLILAVALSMLIEWYDITQSKTNYLLLGLPIIAIPVASLICLRFMQDGQYAILTYFIIIWSVDSAAMFGGRSIGGPKLAPSLSPKKTWSGLLIGALAGGLAPLLLSLLLPNFNFPFTGLSLVIFGFGLGLVEQCSDLFISFFKRKFDIKDSGSIIPGHGGMLDRFDGIILTAPILLWLLI
jgi:phosphatidate cytidylyltransferase